jgi:hypothetical protein
VNSGPKRRAGVVCGGWIFLHVLAGIVEERQEGDNLGLGFDKVLANVPAGKALSAHLCRGGCKIVHAYSSKSAHICAVFALCPVPMGYRA